MKVKEFLDKLEPYFKLNTTKAKVRIMRQILEILGHKHKRLKHDKVKSLKILKISNRAKSI